MIKARWVNGQAIPDEDVNWPEGTVVFVSRLPLLEENSADVPGQDDDPASVIQWLKWYDSLEPLVFDQDEEAEIERVRQQVGEYSRQNMSRGVDCIVVSTDSDLSAVPGLATENWAV